MTFGEKLQRLRQQKGLSQDALSEMLGVTRQAVSKWERDETMPEVEKVLRISEIFGVSLDRLLKDEPEPTYEPQKSKEKKRDLGKQISDLIETKWYYLGLALAVWGIVDLIQQLPVMLFLVSTHVFSIFNLFLLLTPLIKLAGGCILFVWGRKYVEGKQE